MVLFVCLAEANPSRPLLESDNNNNNKARDPLDNLLPGICLMKNQTGWYITMLPRSEMTLCGWQDVRIKEQTHYASFER